MLKHAKLGKFSTRLALISGLLAGAAVILHRLHVVAFQFALPVLAVSTLCGLIAALLGISGLFVAMRQRKSALSSLTGSLLGFVVAMPTVFTLLAASGLPRIHDISTDLDNPPQFTAVPALREATDNPLDRLKPDNLTQLQQAGYPDLKPLQLKRPAPALVFDQALQLAESRGWAIAAASADLGTIEATAVTPVMAFKDDVVIRIQRNGEHTQVDMRSVSRVGVSDLGANAVRIRDFLNDLQQSLN
ncbi:Protein of unknown function [Nitrosomonas sp. Nm51]|uniref:DUF1499 domain-containing protein n=1 Tax=Nitrosomonas sp. Nm51 TaxID=133720 RepID=UPI0008CA2392|nr:DUF1499 domain-containing protein [Nitrosomonas sp. Nm51]SER09726.1 Protein of unknown function [Nitrosomonas sp. Nm51]